ncbi:MAG: hypothetical protein MUE53_00525, partial [Chitinophagales bacterium]|nr:hypothetical protein [Chitinophagales bacterium]
QQVLLTNISAIRNMHCWQMKITYTPISSIGPAYQIEISPIAQMLQDLKLIRNRNAMENFFR